jgi:RNA polymerase sigma-70 factor (ECF subfamily)
MMTEQRIPGSDLETLMTRYAGGDDKAFEDLYDALAPEVRRLLKRRLRNPSRVDDAAQKTFLKVHVARGSYRPGSPVRPWILTIARNVAFDQLRKKSSSEQSLSEEVALRLPDPSDAVEERFALRDLQRALEALPQDKRDVVELHKIEGLSMAQVAARVGINEGTARVRAHRGYKALRQLLAA